MRPEIKAEQRLGASAVGVCQVGGSDLPAARSHRMDRVEVGWRAGRSEERGIEGERAIEAGKGVWMWDGRIARPRPMCLMLVSPSKVSALRRALAGCPIRDSHMSELRVGVAGIGGAGGWMMGAAVPGRSVSEGEVDWEGKNGVPSSSSSIPNLDSHRLSQTQVAALIIENTFTSLSDFDAAAISRPLQLLLARLGDNYSQHFGLSRILGKVGDFADFVAGSGNLELYHLLHRSEILKEYALLAHSGFLAASHKLVVSIEALRFTTESTLAIGQSLESNTDTNSLRRRLALPHQPIALLEILEFSTGTTPNFCSEKLYLRTFTARTLFRDLFLMVPSCRSGAYLPSLLPPPSPYMDNPPHETAERINNSTTCDPESHSQGSGMFSGFQNFIVTAQALTNSTDHCTTSVPSGIFLNAIDVLWRSTRVQPQLRIRSRPTREIREYELAFGELEVRMPARRVFICGELPRLAPTTSDFRGVTASEAFIARSILATTGNPRGITLSV
ncbi:hypothetical protein DFH08DRAFT_937447 [Mycena albidolilacea]|uniref:Uncharacterized protein n=1 Tax=Mycena albidolilacea TaxID=1033008 RepID=A0AAD6ZYJ8_9AGAR|nr:hypothetical protein DFH08DRAFT_937447 [Mycena albidolilacea]